MAKKFIKFKNKIKQLFVFILSIVFHPIINISIWISFLLFLFISFSTYSIQWSGNTMITSSIGLIAIVTFISNYLNSQVVDMDKTSSFYLGVNEKNYFIHKSIWLRAYKNTNTKLMCWLIAILPLFVKSTELKFGDHIFEEYSPDNWYAWLDDKICSFISKIASNVQLFRNLWLSVFFVVVFISVAALIDVLVLTKTSFANNFWYQKHNESARRKIRESISDGVENAIKSYFDFKTLAYCFVNSLFKNDNLLDFYYLLNYYLLHAPKITIDRKDRIEYLQLIFQTENVYLNKQINKYNKKRTLFKVTRMNILFEYLNQKWRLIDCYDFEDLPATNLLEIAQQDIRMLIVNNKSIVSNEKIKNIYYGTYSPIMSFNKTKETEDNKLLSLIIDVMTRKIWGNKMMKDLQLDVETEEDLPNKVKEVIKFLNSMIDIDTKEISVMNGEKGFSKTFAAICISAHDETEIEKRFRKYIVDEPETSIFRKKYEDMGYKINESKNS